MSSEISKKNRQKILVEDPLYTEYDLENINDKNFTKFGIGEGSLDAYCPECKQKSVFHIKGKSYVRDDDVKEFINKRMINITAHCTRDSNNDYNLLNFTNKCHGRLEFCLFRSSNTLIKIGQYPSKAVLDFNSLDPLFSKELDETLRTELGKAIGLRAHGIGVGSFVYLRRIFEHLINEAHQRAKKRSDWNEEKYSNSRMSEKINLLSEFLPARLVKDSNLYGILSTGIHSLKEEECLQYFDLVLGAIKMILKERHEEKEYKKILSDLNKTSSEIKK